MPCLVALGVRKAGAEREGVGEPPHAARSFQHGSLPSAGLLSVGAQAGRGALLPGKERAGGSVGRWVLESSWVEVGACSSDLGGRGIGLWRLSVCPLRRCPVYQTLMSTEKPDTAITSILGGSSSAVVPRPAGGSPSRKRPLSLNLRCSLVPLCPGGCPVGVKRRVHVHKCRCFLGGACRSSPGLRRLFDIFPALFFVLLEHKCVSPGRGSPLRTGAKAGQGRRPNEDKTGKTGKPGGEGRR